MKHTWTWNVKKSFNLLTTSSKQFVGYLVIKFGSDFWGKNVLLLRRTDLRGRKNNCNIYVFCKASIFRLCHKRQPLNTEFTFPAVFVSHLQLLNNAFCLQRKWEKIEKIVGFFSLASVFNFLEWFSSEIKKKYWKMCRIYAKRIYKFEWYACLLTKWFALVKATRFKPLHHNYTKPLCLKITSKMKM